MRWRYVESATDTAETNTDAKIHLDKCLTFTHVAIWPPSFTKLLDLCRGGSVWKARPTTEIAKKNVRNNKSCGDARRQREGQGKRERERKSNRENGKSARKRTRPRKLFTTDSRRPDNPRKPQNETEQSSPACADNSLSVCPSVRPSVCWRCCCWCKSSSISLFYQIHNK